MLSFDIEYEKGHIKRLINDHTDSRIFKVEGRGESGKTTILECMAWAFYLDSESITETSLKNYYNNFVSGADKQKLKFNIKTEFDGICTVASKEFQSSTPIVKINDIEQSSGRVRDKFFVFFDSIKTPEMQAREYVNECERYYHSIRGDLTKFHSFCLKQQQEIDQYDHVERNLQEEIKKKGEADEKLKGIKKRKEEIISERKAIESELEYRKFPEIQANLEFLKQALKDKKGKNKEKSVEKEADTAASAGFIAAKNDFQKWVKNLELLDDYSKIQRRLNLPALKVQAKFEEIRLYQKALRAAKALAERNEKHLLDDPGYLKSENIDKLFRLIRNEGLNDFLKKEYPDIYNQMASELKKTQPLREKLEVSRVDIQFCKDSDSVFQIYLETAKVVQDRSKRGGSVEVVDASESEESIKAKIDALVEEEKDLSKKNLAPNLKYKKLSDDSLSIEQSSLVSQEHQLQNDETLETRNLNTATENVAQYNIRKTNPPEYLKDRVKIEKLNSTLGHIVQKTQKMDMVLRTMSGSVKNQILDADQKKVVEDLNLFFGKSQKWILDDYEKREVEQVDLINKTFICKDGVVVPFTSNTSKILISGLVHRINNLPKNKKSILLIDEVSAIDPVNLQYIISLIKEKISTGQVYFAAITTPSGDTTDTKPRIISCD